MQFSKKIIGERTVCSPLFHTFETTGQYALTTGCNFVSPIERLPYLQLLLVMRAFLEASCWKSNLTTAILYAQGIRIQFFEEVELYFKNLRVLKIIVFLDTMPFSLINRV
jgi:hypothetical protein